MHILRTAVACAFAGALGLQRRSLHAAPLPTNVAAMKSMVADSSIQVRWGWGYWGYGGWRHRGWLARSWERTQEPAAFALDTTGLTTDTTGGAGAIGKETRLHRAVRQGALGHAARSSGPLVLPGSPIRMSDSGA